jgi:hypothetical protein
MSSSDYDADKFPARLNDEELRKKLDPLSLMCSDMVQQSDHSQASTPILKVLGCTSAKRVAMSYLRARQNSTPDAVGHLSTHQLPMMQFF